MAHLVYLGRGCLERRVLTVVDGVTALGVEGTKGEISFWSQDSCGILQICPMNWTILDGLVRSGKFFSTLVLAGIGLDVYMRWRGCAESEET